MSLTDIYLTPTRGGRVLIIDWTAAAARLPHEPTPPLPEVYDRLSVVERASIRVIAPPLANLPVRRGIVAEAAARLCTYGDRGTLQYMSGQQLARALQYALIGIHPVALHYARRGWSLLAAVDALDLGVQVFTGAEPVAADPVHFRRMRLADRLRELDAER